MVNILDCPSRARGSIPLLTVTFFCKLFFLSTITETKLPTADFVVFNVGDCGDCSDGGVYSNQINNQ